jgi:hypothetical protein
MRARMNFRYGMNRIKLILGPGPVQQSELDRNLVKPAGCETPVEMPQSWNDHSSNRYAYIGSRVIENEEIVARSFGKRDASIHLLTSIEMAEL